MLMKSFSLDESSGGFSTTVVEDGVERFGVPGLELGVEVVGVV